MSQVTVQEIKEFCRIIHDADDDLLQRLIDQAEDEALRYLNRTLAPTMPVDYPEEVSSEETPSSEDPAAQSFHRAVTILVQAAYETPNPDDQMKMRKAASALGPDVEAQRYRHRVDIEEKVEEQDSETGALIYEWVEFMGSVPAEVLTGPGREPHQADTKLAETTARINMPWFAGLLPTMRILWDGKVFDIVSIETDATARRQYRVRVKDGMTDGS
jgi:SPP1 family predicted phage head-tail adaptor